MPPGLVPIPQIAGLPPLGSVEFVVLGPGRHHAVATALQETILTSTVELQGLSGESTQASCTRSPITDT
jgi:hypothetical protein